MRRVLDIGVFDFALIYLQLYICIYIYIYPFFLFDLSPLGVIQHPRPRLCNNINCYIFRFISFLEMFVRDCPTKSIHCFCAPSCYFTSTCATFQHYKLFGLSLHCFIKDIRRNIPSTQLYVMLRRYLLLDISVCDYQQTNCQTCRCSLLTTLIVLVLPATCCFEYRSTVCLDVLARFVATPSIL